MWLLLAAAVLSSGGCRKKAADTGSLSVVVTGMEQTEAEALMAKLTSGLDMPVTWEMGEERAAISGVREGSFQCGLGKVDKTAALHYGLLKSPAVSRKSLAVLAAGFCTDFAELSGKNVGCPADLAQEDLEFLREIAGDRLHIYETEERMLEELRDQQLEAAVLDSREAAALVESSSWQGRISQPANGPALYCVMYRT